MDDGPGGVHKESTKETVWVGTIKNPNIAALARLGEDIS